MAANHAEYVVFTINDDITSHLNDNNTSITKFEGRCRFLRCYNTEFLEFLQSKWDISKRNCE